MLEKNLINKKKNGITIYAMYSLHFLSRICNLCNQSLLHSGKAGEYHRNHKEIAIGVGLVAEEPGHSEQWAVPWNWSRIWQPRFGIAANPL